MTVSPIKLLTGSLTNLEATEYWTADDGTGDPFLWVPYRWQVLLTINSQPHSSHVTNSMFSYDGNDVTVGSWVAATTGQAAKIIEIISQSGSEVTCVIEDVERYNLFSNRDQSGMGDVPDGDMVVFDLSPEGLPVLGPMSEGFLSPQTSMNLMARFIGRNLTDQVLVLQELHTFTVGDVIYADFADNAGYEKVDANTLDKAIGIVTETGTPGLDYFHYRPIGKLLNNVKPPLQGSHGDVHYLDPTSPSGLTTTRPSGSAVPLYLQLELPTKAILLERGVEKDNTVDDNSGSETHKYDIEELETNQTSFTLPEDVDDVLYMSINGIENNNYTFDPLTKIVVFDPQTTGYGIDVDDEVFFIYKT